MWEVKPLLLSSGTTSPKSNLRWISGHWRWRQLDLPTFLCHFASRRDVRILAMACRGGGGLGGVQPPPPKFRRPSKIVPNSTRLWKLLKIAEFRTPKPQDVRKKGCKILKLPPVRKCFKLGMTNKLVVIINSLKVPKIKKKLYEMKFLVPNYSCLQNPWLGGYRPKIPVLSVLCPQLNLLNLPPPEQNSWVRHCVIENLNFLSRSCSSDRHVVLSLKLFGGRLLLKYGGTRWRTGEKVKGKLANGVGSQYSSHYL